MIGNYWEWVADWSQAGKAWVDHTFGEGTGVYSWPAGYGDGFDRTWNIDGRSHNGSAFVDGLPAAGIRGGSWSEGSYGGAFAVDWRNAPSYSLAAIVARCCRRSP